MITDAFPYEPGPYLRGHSGEVKAPKVPTPDYRHQERYYLEAIRRYPPGPPFILRPGEYRLNAWSVNG